MIASDSTFAPFEFQNAQGDYVGIDVDLVKRAAELQGFTVEFKFIGFSSAVQAVESGQADGMVAGMTITDDRKKPSTSLFLTLIAVFKLRSKGNDKIKSYDDLKGKKSA